MTHKFRLITDVNPHASRAVGILRGRLVPDLERQPRGFTFVITEREGHTTEIPGVMLDGALNRIQEDPRLMGCEVDLICFPRTVKKNLTIQAYDITKAKGRYNPDQDFFVIVGSRINSRREGVVKLAIRPNRTKKKVSHNFEKFWLELYGYLEGDLQCAYIVKAIRRGSRLFVTESKSRATGNMQKENGRTTNDQPRNSASSKSDSKESFDCGSGNDRIESRQGSSSRSRSLSV